MTLFLTDEHVLFDHFCGHLVEVCWVERVIFSDQMVHNCGTSEHAEIL